ncbi:hypothetical protein Q3G72_000956 [Acer saccharum]|nr:hypothetical protein Q3G72_000956 [Acer saccharum]
MKSKEWMVSFLGDCLRDDHDHEGNSPIEFTWPLADKQGSPSSPTQENRTQAVEGALGKLGTGIYTLSASHSVLNNWVFKERLEESSVCACWNFITCGPSYSYAESRSRSKFYLKDDPETLQKSSGVNSWREEDDREAIGEKLGLSGQSRIGECEAQEKARGRFKRRQNIGGKAANRKNREADQPSSEASEEESGSLTIPRRSRHEKGKYEWVPKPRLPVQRKKYRKLLIRENQDQKGKIGESDNTTSEEEEGLFLEFVKWKGEKGECSKPDQLRQDETVLGGLDNRGTKIGPQNYSRSPSLEGPLKDHLDKVDKEVGLAETVGDKGQQKVVVSKTQSLDGSLKDYLDNLEQAFIWAKLKKSNSQNLMCPIEESNLEVSVSMVKETKDPDDNGIVVEDQGVSRDSFESISATGEEGEADSDSTMKSQRDYQEDSNKGTKVQRKKTKIMENRGEEEIGNDGWKVDEKVIMVMDMGTQLGIDFKGKENEVADFIRRREKEDNDRFGQNDRR